MRSRFSCATWTRATRRRCCGGGAGGLGGVEPPWLCLSGPRTALDSAPCSPRRAPTCTLTQIAAAVAEVRERGFINYFGLQRFGTGHAPTHRCVCVCEALPALCILGTSLQLGCMLCQLARTPNTSRTYTPPLQGGRRAAAGRVGGCCAAHHDRRAVRERRHPGSTAAVHTAGQCQGVFCCV
jgi:hypothetical protein